MVIEFLSKISDIVGISGVILVLVAYFLLTTNRISSQSLCYQLYNFLGASLVLFSLMFNFNLASVIVEISWVIISLVGVYRICIAQKTKINT